MKPSLYKQFIETLCPNRYVYEEEHGFVLYEIIGEQFYLIEMFIEPEHRKNGTARKIWAELLSIARERNCKYILSSWDPRSKVAKESLKAFLAFRLEPLCVQGELVYFIIKV